MKILFGIQITGNGHITRSEVLIKKLESLGHTVDIVVSGSSSGLNVGAKWKFSGFTLFSNGFGGVNYLKSILWVNPFKIVRDVIKLSKEYYDLVISDFEPISIWSSFFGGKKCISICNQNSILDTSGNYLKKLFILIMTFGSIRLKYSYTKLDSSGYYPPVDLGLGEITSGNTIVVYMPYTNYREIIKVAKNFSDVNWVIYCGFDQVISSNILLKKIDRSGFIESLKSSKGVITSCGFSTTIEALYLKKKLWAIPLRGQWEQIENSKILKNLGIFTSEFSVENFKTWEKNYDTVKLEIKDDTVELVEKIIRIGEKG